MPRILVLLLALGLSACAIVPRELRVTESLAATTPQQAQSGKHDGERVRWGGVIIQTTTQTNQTCFEIMGLSLDSSAQPLANDQSLGRFIPAPKAFTSRPCTPPDVKSPSSDTSTVPNNKKSASIITNSRG